MSYRLPLNLVFCTKVVQHCPFNLICCKLKAFTLPWQIVIIWCRWGWSRGGGAIRSTSTFLFFLFLPVQIVHVIVTGKYLQVPQSCVGCGFMQPSTVVVYKLKQKLNVLRSERIAAIHLLRDRIPPFFFIPAKLQPQSWSLSLVCQICVTLFDIQFLFPLLEVIWL